MAATQEDTQKDTKLETEQRPTSAETASSSSTVGLTQKKPTPLQDFLEDFCRMAEHFRSDTHLVTKTPGGKYRDRVERSQFEHAFGVVAPDGTKTDGIFKSPFPESIKNMTPEQTNFFLAESSGVRGIRTFVEYFLEECHLLPREVVESLGFWSHRGYSSGKFRDFRVHNDRMLLDVLNTIRYDQRTPLERAFRQFRSLAEHFRDDALPSQLRSQFERVFGVVEPDGTIVGGIFNDPLPCTIKEMSEELRELMTAGSSEHDVITMVDYFLKRAHKKNKPGSGRVLTPVMDFHSSRCLENLRKTMKQERLDADLKTELQRALHELCGVAERVRLPGTFSLPVNFTVFFAAALGCPLTYVDKSCFEHAFGGVESDGTIVAGIFRYPYPRTLEEMTPEQRQFMAEPLGSGPRLPVIEFLLNELKSDLSIYDMLNDLRERIKKQLEAEKDKTTKLEKDDTTKQNSPLTTQYDKHRADLTVDNRTSYSSSSTMGAVAEMPQKPRSEAPKVGT